METSKSRVKGTKFETHLELLVGQGFRIILQDLFVLIYYDAAAPITGYKKKALLSFEE